MSATTTTTKRALTPPRDAHGARTRCPFVCAYDEEPRAKKRKDPKDEQDKGKQKPPSPTLAHVK